MTQCSLPIQHISLTDGQIEYISCGEGVPILFVHGALSDCRMWEDHIRIVSPHYRGLSYSQRYFGRVPPHASWPPFGVETHADDVLAFIEALGIAPVHLVAWSYGGHVALRAALQRPEYFRSLYVYEPGVPTYVHSARQLDEFGKDAQDMFAEVIDCVGTEGGSERAIALLLDKSAQKTGYFQSLPPRRKDILFANAGTLPMQMTQPPPPNITCRDLKTLTLPVCAARGGETRPLFRIVTDALAQCAPNCRHFVASGQGHMWPDDHPQDFTRSVMDFVQSIS